MLYCGVLTKKKPGKNLKENNSRRIGRFRDLFLQRDWKGKKYFLTQYGLTGASSWSRGDSWVDDPFYWPLNIKISYMTVVLICKNKISSFGQLLKQWILTSTVITLLSSSFIVPPILNVGRYKSPKLNPYFLGRRFLF